MKVLLSTLLLSVTLFYACGQGIKGNGQVTKETRTVSNDFNSIAVSGSFNVFIIEGNNSGNVEIEADNNLLEHIKIEVENNKLHIGFKKKSWVKKCKKLNVYVTAKNLTSLAMSGSGSIIQKGTNSVETFGIGMSGSGEISTSINAKEVKVGMSGSGDIKLTGQTDFVKIGMSGSGDLDAKNLKTKKAKVAVSGSADVSIHASESLKAAVSGSGDVTVYGNPKEFNSTTSGSGDVTKA